jgi:SAM-dependent MidA family methyltransferase
MHASSTVSHHPTGAERLIAAEIRGGGPITFARFMELALFHPEVGYYTRATADVGPEADYMTSPELHPAFGTLLAAQFDEMWRLLGEPAPFWLIEGGPGRGTLMSDVMRAVHEAFPRFAATLRVALVERSASLRHTQAALLGPWADRVVWLDADPATWQPFRAGCVFANELLDALPVHRVVMRSDGLREIYVDLRADRLVEREGELSSPEIAQQIAAGGGRLDVGQRAEVNLAAPAWVAEASHLIERGYLLLVDYGAPADQLYGAVHPRGTLRCYLRHTMNEDPLANVGVQDLTAHVDFSALTRRAEAAGLALVGATTQARLLGRLGIGALLEEIERSVPARSAQRAHRAALHLLVDPHDLGRVLASAFARQAPPDLAGFTRTPPLAPPLVPWLWEPPRLDPRRLLASG